MAETRQLVEAIRDLLAVAHRPKKALKLNDLFALKLSLHDSLSLLTSEERSLSYGDTCQAISDVRVSEAKPVDVPRDTKKKKTGEKFVLKGRFYSDAEINKIQSDLDSLRSFVAVNNTSDDISANEPNTQLSMERSEVSLPNETEHDGQQPERKLDQLACTLSGEEARHGSKDRIWHSNFISDSRDNDLIARHLEVAEGDEEAKEQEVRGANEEGGARG